MIERNSSENSIKTRKIYISAYARESVCMNKSAKMRWEGPLGSPPQWERQAFDPPLSPGGNPLYFPTPLPLSLCLPFMISHRYPHSLPLTHFGFTDFPSFTPFHSYAEYWLLHFLVLEKLHKHFRRHKLISFSLSKSHTHTHTSTWNHTITNKRKHKHSHILNTKFNSIHNS
jgi:hypothetical protein